MIDLEQQLGLLLDSFLPQTILHLMDIEFLTNLVDHLAAAQSL
ncbi:MAG: hypothetical protein ACOYM1_12245 [Methylovulum sp.]